MKQYVGALACLVAGGMYASPLNPMSTISTGVQALLLPMVIISNETDTTLYVALYDYVGTTAKRIETARTIEPRKEMVLNRPFFSRPLNHVVISLRETDLQETLSRFDLNKLLVEEIGMTPKFFLAFDDDILKIYNPAEWRLAYPVTHAAQKAKEAVVGKREDELRARFTLPAYRARVSVMEGTALSEGEQAYLHARLPKVKAALEKMLGMSLNDDEVPRIAFCCSGGGYRSMLATLGLLLGAQQTGLLDSSLYVATLSGSAWLVAPWISSGFSLDVYRDQLIPRLEQNLLQTPLNSQQVELMLFKKYVFSQPFSLTDIFGALLAQKLLSGFKPDPNQVYLAEQASRMSGDTIFPLYTAVIGDRPYEWMEFNPYVTGSDYLGGYIPSSAFGRKFSNGQSVNTAPPQSLGFLMAMWGWVLGANAQDIVEVFQKLIFPSFLREALKAAGNNMSIAQLRPFPVPVLNYVYGMKLPYGLQPQLPLIDAGIDFNHPLPVLFKPERKVDLIIMLDATDFPKIESATQMEFAEAYAKRKGYKFPAIHRRDLTQKNYSVFRRKKYPQVPTILYIPFAKNERYSKTFDPEAIIKAGGYLITRNFVYTKAQADEAIGLAAFAAKDARELINDTLKDIITAKRKLKESASR